MIMSVGEPPGNNPNTPIRKLNEDEDSIEYMTPTPNDRHEIIHYLRCTSMKKRKKVKNYARLASVDGRSTISLATCDFHKTKPQRKVKNPSEYATIDNLQTFDRTMIGTNGTAVRESVCSTGGKETTEGSSWTNEKYTAVRMERDTNAKKFDIADL